MLTKNFVCENFQHINLSLLKIFGIKIFALNYDTLQAWDSHFTGNARAWCVLLLTQVYVRAMTFMQSMWSPSQQPSLEIIAKVGDPVPIAAWWTGRILQARNPVYISCPERGSNH